MTRHSLIRPLFLLGIRAAFVGIVSSVVAPALAADTEAASRPRSSHPHSAAQGQVVTQPAPIQAALNLLRWPANQTPVIIVVAEHPQVVNPLAQAWVVYNTNGSAQPTIYVAGWSALYRDALANPHVPHTIIRLAGVLAHERVHIRHGPDEDLAYAEQLTTLERLHAEPIEITNVQRALVESRRQQRGRR